MQRTAVPMIRAGLVAVAAAWVLGCDAETVIGPEGGVLVSDDGRFSLDIPAGALGADIELSVVEVECQLEDYVDACYSALPRGTTFRLPAEVSYDLEAPLMGDVALVTLTAEGWRTLPDHRVHAAHGVVTGSAMYLSDYELVRVQH